MQNAESASTLLRIPFGIGQDLVDQTKDAHFESTLLSRRHQSNVRQKTFEEIQIGIVRLLVRHQFDALRLGLIQIGNGWSVPFGGACLVQRCLLNMQLLIIGQRFIQFGGAVEKHKLTAIGASGWDERCFRCLFLWFRYRVHFDYLIFDGILTALLEINRGRIHRRLPYAGSTFGEGQ